MSSSLMILMICWPGWTLWMTSSAERLRFDALDEIARHLEIDIRFQQGHAHFAQGIGDVALGNLSQAAQIFKHLLQFAA